jgi:hypothetical protein
MNRFAIYIGRGLIIENIQNMFAEYMNLIFHITKNKILTVTLI